MGYTEVKIIFLENPGCLSFFVFVTKKGSREAATPFLDNGEIGGFPEFFTFFGSALGGFIWRPEFFEPNYETGRDGKPNVQASFLT